MRRLSHLAQCYQQGSYEDETDETSSLWPWDVLWPRIFVWPWSCDIRLGSDLHRQHGLNHGGLQEAKRSGVVKHTKKQVEKL